MYAAREIIKCLNFSISQKSQQSNEFSRHTVEDFTLMQVIFYFQQTEIQSMCSKSSFKYVK